MTNMRKRGGRQKRRRPKNGYRRKDAAKWIPTTGDPDGLQGRLLKTGIRYYAAEQDGELEDNEVHSTFDRLHTM